MDKLGIGLTAIGAKIHTRSLFNIYHGYIEPDLPIDLNSIIQNPEMTIGPSKNALRLVDEFIGHGVNEEVGMSLDEWLGTPRYLKDAVLMSLESLSDRRKIEARELERKEE